MDTYNEMKHYFGDEDSDEDYNECILNPDNDRRKIICDSQNKDDGIIQCIGSIECQYIPDSTAKATEKTHGTGTIIHIDDQNEAYILTAAHTICVLERQCKKCKRKTINSVCQATNCKSNTIKTGTIIEPTHIYFSRRSNGINNMGGSVRAYQIENYEVHPKYKEFPGPVKGYDIAIMMFNCDDQDGIVLYHEMCPEISIISDQTLGGNKCVLNIFGYPGEKREVKSHRIYYYLFGMGTSKLEAGNKFMLKQNDTTKKSFIVNKGIDTSGGQSGSAIYSNDRGMYLVYGVHTGGSSKKQANYGTFFDIDMIEWMAKILARDANHLKNILLNKFIVSQYTMVIFRELSRQKQLDITVVVSVPKTGEVRMEKFKVYPDCTVQKFKRIIEQRTKIAVKNQRITIGDFDGNKELENEKFIQFYAVKQRSYLHLRDISNERENDVNNAVDNDKLKQILTLNGLYTQLYDILCFNEFDIETLKNDIEANELTDSDFNDFGINSNETKVAFQRLLMIVKNQINVVLIGDANIGKKSLVQRYISDTFSSEEQKESQIWTKKQELTDLETEMDLNIIILSNVSELNENKNKNSLILVDVIMVCYDTNNEKTFENCCEFSAHILRYKKETNNKLMTVLVGLQSDIQNMNREIEDAKAEQKMSMKEWKELNVNDCQCSAKSGVNVTPLFLTACEMVYMQRQLKGAASQFICKMDSTKIDSIRRLN